MVESRSKYTDISTVIECGLCRINFHVTVSPNFVFFNEISLLHVVLK